MALGNLPLSVFRSLDLDESEEQVTGVAARLFALHLYNASAGDVFVKLYNATAANVTVGTTTPVLTIPLAAASTVTLELPGGVEFDTALTAAATTGVADADTGAPAANDVIVALFYS